MFKVTYVKASGEKTDEVFLGDPEEIKKDLSIKGGVIISFEKVRTRKVKQAFLMNFMNTLGDYLSSGISLSHALNRMSRINNVAVREIAEQCYKSILQGYPLSYTLSSLDIFSETVISMIKSGEESGKLAEGLYTASNYMQEMRGRTKEAMKKLTYPMFLMAFATCSLLLNAFVILPKLKDSDMVQTVGQNNMAMYDNIGNMAKGLALTFPCLFILFAVFAVIYRSNPEIVGKVKIPMVKKLLLNQLYYTAFFNLYQLFSAGVRPSMALEIIKNGATNHIIKKEFEAALACMMQGENFANGFKHIEPEERDMLESAVNMGATEKILKNIYIRYEREYLATIGRLVPIINTVAMLLVLTAVGVLAFMLIATQATMLKDIMSM